MQLERRLRVDLEGVRLVSEINIDGDLRAEVAASIAEQTVLENGPRIARLYPATFVVYLVAEGMRGYDGGLWDNLEVRLDQTWAGPHFLTALEMLGLPTFEEETEGGLRYISKILLHGGIPQYCAPDVLRLIARTLEVAPGEAAELLQRWQRDETALEHLDKPAQRFLLHGGAESLALIDRLIEMFRRSVSGEEDDIDSLGLPAYMVEEFRNLPKLVRQSARGLVRPRPRVELGEAGTGPVMVLPAHTSGPDVTWLVHAGDRQVARDGSSAHSQEIPLDPNGRWRVELGDERNYTYDFVGNRRVPVFFFDASSKVLVKQQDQISAGRLLALAPRRFEFRLDGPSGRLVRRGHGEPDLNGEWSRWQVQDLILEAGDTVWIGDPTDADAPTASLHVTRPPIRPFLDGRLVPGLVAKGGVPVYAGRPTIVIDEVMTKPRAYSVRLRSLVTGLVLMWPLGELAGSGNRFALPEVDALADNFELDVIGPLGADLRRHRFCQVRSAASSNIPTRLLGPHDVIDIEVDLDGETLTATVESGETTVPLTSVAAVELAAEVRRVRWALRRVHVTSAPTVQPLSFGANEFSGGEDFAIVVHAASNAWVSLALCGERGQLQSVAVQLREGEESALIPLSGYADTVATAGEGKLRFELRVTDGGTVIEALAASVVGEFIIADLDVRLDPNTATVTASWTENKRFPDRCLRLWPVADDQVRPFVFSVPAAACGHAAWSVRTDTPLCGGFIAELAINDEWAVPTRPTLGDKGTYVELGGEEAYLVACEARHRGDRLVTIAAKACSIHGRPPLDREGLEAAATWLIVLTAAAGADTLNSAVARRIREALLEEPGDGMRAIVSAAHHWSGSQSTLRLIQVLMLDDALTVPARDLTEDEWDGLSEALPLLWAAMDTHGSEGRWRRVTGWPTAAQSAPEAGLPVHASFLKWTPDEARESLHRLRENTAGTQRDAAKLLSWGRHQVGVFGWLISQNGLDHSGTKTWQDAWSRLNTSSLGELGPDISRSLAHLRGKEPTAGAHDRNLRVVKFPSDVLAAALHVVAATSKRDEAQRALLEASLVAPELTERMATLAIALLHRNQIASPAS